MRQLLPKEQRLPRENTLNIDSFFHSQENHAEQEGQNHALGSEISGKTSKQGCPVFSGV